MAIFPRELSSWDVSRVLKPVKTRAAENGQQRENGYSPDTAIFDRIEGEKAKLSLYQTDPLVDVKGLKRCSSPSDNECWRLVCNLLVWILIVALRLIRMEEEEKMFWARFLFRRAVWEGSCPDCHRPLEMWKIIPSMLIVLVKILATFLCFWRYVLMSSCILSCWWQFCEEDLR